MISFKRFLFEEGMTPSDILFNPENNDTTWRELVEKFKASGGTMADSGRAPVMMHPDWDHVVKLFNDDMSYLKFVRWVMKKSNPNSAFPIFKDKPRSIVPNYKRGYEDEKMYAARIEELSPISKEDYLDLLEFCDTVDADGNNRWYEMKDKRTLEYEEEHGPNPRTVSQDKMIERVKKRHPNWKDIKPAKTELVMAGLWNDEKQTNVMLRDNGEVVYIDPVWDGVSFAEMQRDAMRDRDGEYHDYDPGYDDPDYSPPEPPSLQGGEKIKRKRIKKKMPTPKPEASPTWDDTESEIPF